MIITTIEIENIRSLKQVVWEVEPKRAKGWHVILGDNGAGKSTFLRSVALALIGPRDAVALLLDLPEWLTHGQKFGFASLGMFADPRWDRFFDVLGYSEQILELGIGLSEIDAAPERVVSMEWLGNISEELQGQLNFQSLRGTGWFCASYGPFRRFSGGDEDVKRMSSNPRVAPHITLFEEGFALTEVLKWLEELQFKSFEDPSGKLLIDKLKAFINHPGFLPHGVRLDRITSDGVKFLDLDRNVIRLQNLSDGYRSILSMTLEIIRQLIRTYDQEYVFNSNDPSKIIAPGVVLIDEIDVHLHPSWQREVGHWFTRHFPNIQFIVTTHSPLVCQAAGEGSIFRLPTPGTDETGRMVTGTEFERLVNGNILEAYDTPAFGLELTRSDESQHDLERLTELNLRELEEGLSPQEMEEQEKLRAAMPTSAHAFPDSYKRSRRSARGAKAPGVHIQEVDET